jgi:hypothetical protein
VTDPRIPEPPLVQQHRVATGRQSGPTRLRNR